MDFFLMVNFIFQAAFQENVGRQVRNFHGIPFIKLKQCCFLTP